MSYLDGLRELVGAYKAAQDSITREISSALRSGNLQRVTDRRLSLGRVLGMLLNLGDQTDPLAREVVRDAHTEGTNRADQALKGIGVQPTFRDSFATTGEVEVMQDALLGKLSDARRRVGRRIEDVYARAGRRQAALVHLGSHPNSQAAHIKQMVEELQRHGVKAFTDRAGREWGLENYAEMAVRTATAEAQTEATIKRMTEHGVTLARVSKHQNPAKICEPWQGKLVSLDGQTEELRGERAYALHELPWGGPPMHPNCRHILLPVSPRMEEIRRKREEAASGVA